MGIDIFACWSGQTKEDKQKQDKNWLNIDQGRVGYLREAYHGEPYATRVLLPELWQDGIDPCEGVIIPASTLRERLGPTLSAAMLRQAKLYREMEDSEHTRVVCEAFRDFVALCERREAETGEPCRIIGWY